MRSGNERRRFWVEIHSKSFGASHRLVKKRKKSRKDGRREESSLTVNGVMKEGGQGVSDDPSGGARSSRSSEPSSNLDGCGWLRAEMRSSESCPPTKRTVCLNGQHFLSSRPETTEVQICVEVLLSEGLCRGPAGANPIPI